MLKNKLEILEHGMANQLTPIRIRLEKFLLDYQDGRLKNKSDRAALKQAIVTIKGAIAQIDDILC